ncbi:MAG: prepilin-type N-terminal cleavage/methylation domain-containing protein [Lachnospiraceae bacterium]|nr:prepilin-type N-terminal cleavage/methylation domain-containing protein [Lachnospiraceae bacterium]
MNITWNYLKNALENLRNDQRGVSLVEVIVTILMIALIVFVVYKVGSFILG